MNIVWPVLAAIGMVMLTAPFWMSACSAALREMPETRAGLAKFKRNFGRWQAQRAIARVIQWTPPEDLETHAAILQLLAATERDACSDNIARLKAELEHHWKRTGTPPPADWGGRLR